MNDDSEGKTPSGWMRVLGIVGAAFMVVYGIKGLLRNDLHEFPIRARDRALLGLRKLHFLRSHDVPESSYR